MELEDCVIELLSIGGYIEDESLVDRLLSVVLTLETIKIVETLPVTRQAINFTGRKFRD